MNTPWVSRPLGVHSNTTLELAVGVQLWAKRGEFHGNGDSMLTLTDVSNVNVVGYGASITMHKADYASANYSQSEYRNCIRLFSVTHVSISGLLLRRSPERCWPEMRWAAAALAAMLAALCCEHGAGAFKADVLPTMKVRLPLSLQPTRLFAATHCTTGCSTTPQLCGPSRPGGR